jgi:hypothetical protein
MPIVVANHLAHLLDFTFFSQCAFSPLGLQSI